jgi:hypothetical protein
MDPMRQRFQVIGEPVHCDRHLLLHVAVRAHFGPSAMPCSKAIIVLSWGTRFGPGAVDSDYIIAAVC